MAEVRDNSDVPQVLRFLLMLRYYTLKLRAIEMCNSLVLFKGVGKEEYLSRRSFVYFLVKKLGMVSLYEGTSFPISHRIRALNS